MADGQRLRFRAHARKPVRLAAVLAHHERGWQRDVIVFDLGLGGACVEAPFVRSGAAGADVTWSSAPQDALGVGERVQVSFVMKERWDPLQIPARVAWTSAERAGLAFEYPSPETTWGVFELLVEGK